MSNREPISPRQAKILAAIVNQNCETGQPVASKDLVEKYNFEVSPATIRNEMAALEKHGYIYQPYTSAGRVPTDQGFRFFVNQLMDHVRLSNKQQASLRKEVVKLQVVNSEIGRRLAKLLASETSQASFAILPEEVSSVGLANLFNNEQTSTEDAREIAEFFDHLDEHAERILDQYGQNDHAEAFIGKEITLSKRNDYSMLISRVELPSGKKGVIGLIGPKTMHYPKNLSLLEYISKLIGGGLPVLLLITLT